MNVSRTVLLLVGLVGAFGSGCAVRVVGRAHVHAHHVVVYDEAPELVYVEPGVYVVRDSDVAVYYVDGYYWRHSGGVWYRTGYWSDPWVTVHVGHVPRFVAHSNHNHYVRFRGHAGAHTFRQTKPGHHGASPSGGSASHATAGHHGPDKPSHDKPQVEAGARAEVRVSPQAHESKTTRVDRDADARPHAKSANDDSRSRSEHSSNEQKVTRPSAEANVKTERRASSRPESDSRAERSPSRSSSSSAQAPQKKQTKKATSKKKSRR